MKQHIFFPKKDENRKRAADAVLERLCALASAIAEQRTDRIREIGGSPIIFFGVLVFNSVKTAVPDDGRPPGALVLTMLAK